MRELLQRSSAYKIIASDKKNGLLSHGYLVVCQDGDMHGEYLKMLAKLMMCDSEEFCDCCRICKLTDTWSHPDILLFPKEGKLKTDSADELVRQSFVRPFELDKKLFVVKRIEELNQNQNKLLKTLEEPPKNTHLLISCERPSAVLSTIKSRAKVVEIPLFTKEEILSFAKRQGYAGERLELSAILCGGKVGQFKRYYENEDLLRIKDLAIEVLTVMNTKTLPSYSARLKNISLQDFMSILKVVLGNLMEYFTFKRESPGYEALYQNSQKLRYGSVIAIIERINVLERSAHFNLNSTILADSILFAVMEEKTKWQKLSV